MLTQRFESLGLSTPAEVSTSSGGSGSSGGGSAGRGLRLSRLLPRSGKPMGIQKVTNYSAQASALCSLLACLATCTWPKLVSISFFVADACISIHPHPYPPQWAKDKQRLSAGFLLPTLRKPS